MRIWTVHPKYLDRQGLVALWREGLLAQAVLLGKTRGYVHHPQLFRFRSQSAPASAIAKYLEVVHIESMRRGYAFDSSRIRGNRMRKRISETEGQLQHEWSHLLGKLRVRSPEHFESLRHIKTPDAHPLFEIVAGEARRWEKLQQNPAPEVTARKPAETAKI